VLFMDIVGFSLLPMNEERQLLRDLQKTVMGTADFVRAQQKNQLISLPTGDGMALVFFGDVEAPIRCALELGRTLAGASPRISLRMRTKRSGGKEVAPPAIAGVANAVRKGGKHAGSHGSIYPTKGSST